MVRFSRGLVDHEHDRRKRERLFLFTLLPATAAAAYFDRGFRRAMAKRASAMEKFVGSGSAVQPFTCDSSAENALAVLVQLHAGRCRAKDLSRKFLCRNAGVRSPHRASHIIRAARVRFWRRAGATVLRAARFGHALHFSLSALWAVPKRARETDRHRR